MLFFFRFPTNSAVSARLIGGIFCCDKIDCVSCSCSMLTCSSCWAQVYVCLPIIDVYPDDIIR